MRKIFPLLILIALSGCADIDRGLYSVSNTVAPVDRFTGQRSLSFADRQTQIQQSNQAGDQFLAQYTNAGKPINEQVSKAQYARLQRVFSRIHSVSHLSNESWTAYLLPDDLWNAQTMGGTQIFVFKKLMDDVKSDDELAAIIGHEIGHVSANHVYEKQSYTMAASLRGKKGAQKADFQNAFTVTQEEEADQIGILYAALAGYDPYAASRIWKQMYDGQGDWLSNHPTNSQRYKASQELAKQYSQYYMPGKVNPRHADILETLAGGGQDSQRPAPGEGGGLQAVLETAADVLNKHNQAKAEQFNQRAIAQFTQYVGQSIAVGGRRITDAHTLQVYLTYKGAYPVKDLNLVAVLGREQATDHTENIIQPATNMVAEFRFATADLRSVNINQIPIGVVHAEQP